MTRDRAAGIARVSWTPRRAGRRPRRGPSGWPRWAGAGWSPSGIAPDGELAEIAAGFSLDIAVLERAHGVDAVELALRSAAPQPPAGPAPEGTGPRAAVTVQLRSTLPPGEAGRVTGRLPGTGPLPKRDAGVDVVAVSGYEPGDRLDGWYDALLATVSAGAPDTASAARAAAEVLAALPGRGRAARRTRGARRPRAAGHRPPDPGA